MKIREILRRKGHDVVTVAPTSSVLDAVRTLVEHNIGSLVVIDEGDAPAGIITERDVLRLTSRAPGTLDETAVASAMTRDLVTATPDDELHEMMGVMTERRIRHLPVLEEGRLAGIVSIGDLVNACWSEARDENAHLREYIHRGG
ncbi:MAG TPA: CBS domain-containing protein [Longimicrobiales bacterium]|nr:CBS domain-containing protein [Longimicrobiales bacterium]